MDSLKIGVIGGGFGKLHLQGYRACQGVEIAAFCQRTRTQAEHVAQEFGIPHVYTDYPELLAQKDLDAVSIVAPPHLHRQIAKEAFARGLHVLCEKPLAMNVAEAEEMRDSARKAGRVGMTVFNHRYIPAMTYMKELLDEGYVGKRIFHVEARWFSESRNRPFYWRHQKELAGFGVLADAGVHVIDRLRWLIGEFTQVWGDEQTFISERPDHFGATHPVTVEDCFTVLGRLAGGPYACIRLSGLVKKLTHQGLEVFGDDGMLRFVFEPTGPDWIKGKLWGAHGGDKGPAPLEIPARLTRGLDLSRPDLAAGQFIFAQVARRFLEAIRHSAEVNFDDGVAAQRVLDAVAKSVEEKAWIAV